MITPDSIDLLAFLESEPVERRSEDGYFCYRARDQRGVDAFFSFHAVEQSIQIRLQLDGKDLATYCEELTSEISIKSDETGDYLQCLFALGNAARSQATFRISPEIQVHWHTLEI